mmetsp:Transcript_14707/g.17015  ORF Transcript_14707/g.17015 Transcript_14707/m.17015 type:complete len:85 (+) Transcript_14707:360-614(+)
MMFRAFNSVDRKVKIIQKRWKSKSEVNKARINFLSTYWNYETKAIIDIIECKEVKTKSDKTIIRKLKNFNSGIRDLIIKDYYFS